MLRLIKEIQSYTERKVMKVFDLHIGLSDSILLQQSKKFKMSGMEVPKQFTFDMTSNSDLDTFCGMMCPVVFSNNDFIIPQDSKREILKHIAIYENLEKLGELKITKDRNDLNLNGLKVILGIEGIYFLRNNEDLDFLNECIDRGIKIIGPMWSLKSNIINSKTITPLGKEFLQLCEDKNIILDLAHSEEREFEILLNNYNGKVLDSHTCFKEVFKHKRNISDSQIKNIIEKNGLIGLNFVGEFIGGNYIKDVINHILYFLNKFGDENISIGSDFEGMDKSDLILNLDDITKYSNLIKALTTVGIPQGSINKILFDNAEKFLLNQL